MIILKLWNSFCFFLIRVTLNDNDFDKSDKEKQSHLLKGNLTIQKEM